MISRRHFLHSAGALFAASASSSVFALPKFSSLEREAVSQLTHYREKIGDTFYARAEHGTLALTLVDIEDQYENDIYQQFVLVFDTQGNSCADELYKVTHVKSFNSSLLRLDKSDTDNRLVKSRFCLLK
ncbi:hypothetical protein HII17_18585 [Thalassotalea sp. M1531]|uniref:Twin-arginine translocation signal domain-containing protein n=1 Tax=Thalassotalea algicola TaxID=2716224 RepID=A0A7Y0Q7Y0_9GAMM|nr:hypothetical protein [Thalassotalea algicola]NMP33559.1 hypothetical protein [Thalassotalea algicola]